MRRNAPTLQSLFSAAALLCILLAACMSASTPAAAPTTAPTPADAPDTPTPTSVTLHADGPVETPEAARIGEDAAIFHGLPQDVRASLANDVVPTLERQGASDESIRQFLEEIVRVERAVQAELAVAGAAAPIAQAAPAAAPDDLPPAVRILPPEYHHAYRLLPTEGPWTRRYIAGSLGSFDYEEWEQLPWVDEVQGEYQPTLGIQAETTEIIPMLRVAERDPDAEAWILEKVKAFAPEAAEQLRSVEDISGRVEVFRKLVEVDGFEWEVRELSIEWGGKVAGQPDDFMARIIELQRADYEYMTDVSISWKQRLLDGNKADVCNLLLWLVLGGEYPKSVIIGGASWCDIDVAIELAEAALLANDGQPAMSEDDVREWMEFDAE